MLEKYIDWDKAVIELLQKHDDNQILLMNLRDQYSTLTQSLESVSSKNYRRDCVVETGRASSDRMVNQVMYKEVIHKKMLELKQEDALYSRAWNALTGDEQRILQEFFRCGHCSAQQSMDTLCQIYGYERATIYRMRANALKRFKQLLFG